MEYQKEFIKKFNKTSAGCNSYTLWSDFIIMSACSIRNALPVGNKEKYEEEYLIHVKHFEHPEKIAELFGLTVLAIEENPDQDFLGDVFTRLKLNDSKLGQIFTPYHISKLMAEMNCIQQAEEPWVSVYDPCVGAGSMLIAAANVYKEMGINYQTSVFFVGQDIDRILALTAYVQLSLLGCAGYVIVGNSLADSVSGSVLNPVVSSNSEIWYTPMYFRNVWQYRRLRRK